MNNVQLYIAVGLPTIAVLTSLVISLVQISAFREEMRAQIATVHEEMREIRADLRKIRSDIKLLTGSTPVPNMRSTASGFWAAPPNVDTSTAEQFDFYDYTNLNNRGETGNDYYSTNTTSNTLRSAMAAALGNSASGLIHSVLMAPLQGSGLAAVHANAMNAFNDWVSEELKLDGPGCTS